MNSKTNLCPQCGAEVQRESKHFPFCSKRCQLIDLGNWANESYSIPGQSLSESGTLSEGQEEREESEGNGPILH